MPGLSGPAIKPTSLAMVYKMAGAVDIPIIGIGGIASAQDALKFIIAGTSAVQVDTADFLNPRACLDILDGIQDFLRSAGAESLS